jgi:hypothetical protein
MKKLLLILLAIALALSIGLIGCGDDGDGNGELPDEPTVLKVSLARDTDGEPLTVFDLLAAGPVYREFADYVNNDLGGITLSAYPGSPKKQIQLDVREITVDPWNIGTITTGICSDIAAGTSHFLLGGPGTDCIYTQAPICNQNNVVLMTLEGGATTIANDPNKLALWPYVFINLSYSDWYQLPVLADTLEAALGKGEGAVTAYVTRIAGEHGDEYYGVADNNFDVVNPPGVELPFDPAALTPAAADAIIDAAIVAYNSTPFDLFCCFAYVDHVNTITAAIQTWVNGSLGMLNPEAIVMGPGGNFGSYGLDPNVEGIMSFGLAAYNKTDITNITPVYDRIAARLTAEDPTGFGLPGGWLLDYWGIPCYWAGLEMWVKAIEDVGYVDQTELMLALAKPTQASPVTTILGDTWYRMYGAGAGYGGGNLDYLCHTGEIGQWQSGIFEIVGPVNAGVAVPGLPNYVVTANFNLMRDSWAWCPCGP